MLFLIQGLSSCKKFLETKSNQSISRPETLADLQMLLDNPQKNFSAEMFNTLTDEVYLDEEIVNILDDFFGYGYLWHPELNDYSDWVNLYGNVYTANNILFNLETVNKQGKEEEARNIKGAALFLRSSSFFQVAQLFAAQYEASSAGNQAGIPLRLNASFSEPSVRSSLAQTYAQIINDLEEAANLLPSSSIVKRRANKSVCYGLLARVYLQMGDYSKAKSNADACLQLKNSLIDYRTVNPDPLYPFGDFADNPEVIYLIRAGGISGAEGLAKIDTVFYQSYSSNDLRKSLFFMANPDGSHSFRGKYTGDNTVFNGIATDEMFLIKAECEARLGDFATAMQTLNLLLIKRYDASFIPLTATGTADALAKILIERQKELVTRGLRWPDLRRLNKENAFATTLIRKVGAKTYTLAPNDLRYTLLIPREVMNLTNMQQNPR